MAEAKLESASMRLCEMAAGERPQEKQERLGASYLSDAELLAMILRSGSEGHDVLRVAHTLLSAGGGTLGGLLSFNATELRAVKGIGRVKAQQLLSVLEIARRVLAQRDTTPTRIEQPEDVVRLLAPEILGLEIERLWVICLNRKNGVIRVHTATSGTATSSLVHPREVFREAIKAGAASVICAHNHPSGDPSPSPQDFNATRTLREAAQILELPLQDHVVIGSAAADPRKLGYYSFRANGLLG